MELSQDQDGTAKHTKISLVYVLCNYLTILHHSNNDRKR
uniref:Uncharacterized protein n=1 Tax=Arundo donax TaxID=35708 RepID=A0A0A9B5E0_ARUDO